MNYVSVIASTGLPTPNTCETGSSTSKSISSLLKKSDYLPDKGLTKTASMTRAAEASKAAQKPGRHDRSRFRLQKAADVGRSSASVLLSALTISAIFII